LGHRIAFEFMEKMYYNLRFFNNFRDTFRQLSRIKKTQITDFEYRTYYVDSISKFAADMTTGRLILDTYVCSHEHIPASENYDLELLLNNLFIEKDVKKEFIKVNDLVFNASVVE